MATFRDSFIEFMERYKKAPPEELKKLAGRLDLSTEEIERARQEFILYFETTDEKEAKKHFKNYRSIIER